MTGENESKVHALHPDRALAATDIAILASGLDAVPLDATTRDTLKQRVLRAAFNTTSDSGSRVVAAQAGTWVDLFPGVQIKALRVDRPLRSQTSLWQLAPGACLPEHDHSAEEECLVVAGAVEWSGDTYSAGDYLLVRAGFHHTEIRSAGGATLLIRGELTAGLEQAFAAHV